MNQYANLLRIKIESVTDLPQLAWATGITVSCPRAFAQEMVPLSANTKQINLALHANLLNSATVKQASAAAEQIRLQAAFTPLKPTSSRLPINYQRIPTIVRDGVARVIGRVKRRQTKKWAQFPLWPLDLSADFLADLHPEQVNPFAKRPTPVLLTHDLDSPEGLKNVVRYFLPLEEAVGARSANYIVPCAWPIDHVCLDELAERGHEIGVHGFDHSNKTPFLSLAQRQQRLAAAKPLIDRYHIHGYRAPSLLRTKELLQDLTSWYRYDSSIPTSGGLFPVPNNGCATARPFQLAGIWEIPLSMPRDGSLLFLGYSYENILTLWIECAELIAASGGVVNLLTHCENRFSGRAPMRDIYQRLLSYLANTGRFKFMLPKELLSCL